ncbi:hypothetical protein [Paenibacillus terrae]|uniref:Uncharacterized protein n=1 Tax=Paenibacillus terrae TaxID=159743 RepID=A0A0D7WXR1_9BACL|nr:hypothetical protein [Paenibacillus terrae]KJD42532.1 hypothetical protein QD47_27655 [Paenibacillus terrae]
MVQEHDMIPIIEKFFQTMGYFTFTEVAVGGAGHGIADVVAVKINPDKVKQRILNNQFTSIKSEVLVELLKFISEEENGTSITKLESKFSYSRAYLKRELINKLLEGNYVVEVNKNVYKKINHIVPLASEVIAIEAKMESWIAATQQARRYQTYANKVYVALLCDFVHRVDQERLKKNNVGLISVDVKSFRASFLWKSRFRKPINRNVNFLAHESIWERMRFNVNDYLFGEDELTNEHNRV